MSTFHSCDNKTYTSTLYESHSDHLYTCDILASSNCEYLLRAESNTVSLYSSSRQETIKTWYNNDIWSIQSNITDPQILSLSNDGCLTWLTNNSNIPISQFCDPCTPQTSFFTTSMQSIQSINNNETQNGLWILPISLCIVAIVIGFMLLLGMCCRRRKWSKQQKYILKNFHTQKSKGTKFYKFKSTKLPTGDYMSSDSEMELGLNVPIRYNDSSDSDYEIQENNCVGSPVIEKQNKVKISISDISDSSNDAPEPELELMNSKKMLADNYVPTKVDNNKGELKLGIFKISL